MIDRQVQHGNFKENAELVQDLKYAMKRSYKPYTPAPVKEALDNICQKIGRIITGQYDYEDHWLDIQGYSERILELIRKKEIRACNTCWTIEKIQSEGAKNGNKDL